MRKLAALTLITALWGQVPGGFQPPSPPQVPPDLQPVWDQYEALITEYPEEPLLHYNFGNLAYGTGDFAKALDEYQAALASGNKIAQARTYYNLGNSLFRAGRLEDASAFYRKALELDPADADARINYEIATHQAAQQEQKDTPASDPDAEDQQKESSDQGESRDDPGNEGDEQEDQGQQERSEQDEERQAKQNQSEAESREARQDEIQREEAEAILNALKANEDNLLKRQYKTAQSIKLEKDW